MHLLGPLAWSEGGPKKSDADSTGLFGIYSGDYSRAGNKNHVLKSIVFV